MTIIRTPRTVVILIYYYYCCYVQGFPYGTKPGEEERVSLPNAKYTQGNYEVSVQFTPSILAV